MNKAGIVDAVHAILGGTKVQAEQAVDTVFDSIVNTMKRGEEVSVAGLGIFSVKQRAAREARPGRCRCRHAGIPRQSGREIRKPEARRRATENLRRSIQSQQSHRRQCRPEMDR